ncbi:HlyD family secretion protein [Flavobacterium frigoris]|uniref:Multidrug resistance efflux pump n=1 Tax=Flavobacterium frigoris TaxID=229204 RepID=A0A1H9NSW0_FLAFI|nr:HlyD family efflux transporter periplasmic adaptor subunit [Flavobacterium frigoris]SER39134.1 Multidrug resistance efflux pump [Flavobacterium frigoris]
MVEDNTAFELRSEEVQDILTRVPHWMIRWGTVVVFGIIIMLFFVSWFVKYPDVITTQVIITTNIPPEKLVAKTSGRIQSILIADKSIVVANTPLAIIDNPANFKDVFLLKSILDTLKINNSESKFPFELLRNAQLGDVESAFSIFQKDAVAYDLNSNLHPFQVENNANSSENIQIKERLSLLQQQKDINESELQLQKNDVNRFETLFNKGVVSAQDFENKKLGYLQAQKNYKSLLSSISQLKSSLISNRKNSDGTRISGKKEEVNLEGNRIQSFYQLKKVIKDWELAYVLKSSIAGKVSFLQIWTANQTIKAGDNAFSIIPTIENGYIGKVKAPAQNSGKIKIGQQVNIRLANFPNREFGTLTGKVKNISLIPDAEGNLLLDISLPENLKTNYNKIIPFQQEMTGSAEIITEDLRLLERILYQFRSILKAN